MNQRSGFTLTELMVVILVLGLAAGTAGMALNVAFRSHSGPNAGIIRMRALAVIEGRAQQLEVRDSAGAWVENVLLLPDGRVLGGGVDPLTGEGFDAN